MGVAPAQVDVTETGGGQGQLTLVGDLIQTHAVFRVAAAAPVPVADAVGATLVVSVAPN